MTKNVIIANSFIINNFSISEIYNAGSVFEDASVETVIISLVKNNTSKKTKIINSGKTYFIDLLENIEFTEDKKFLILITPEISKIVKKLNLNTRLNEYAKTWRGLTTGNDKKYLSSSNSNLAHKPLITGSDIIRFAPLNNKKFVLYLPEELDRARDERIFLLKEKLISKFVGDKLCFTIDTNQFYVLNSACVTEIISSNINIYYLLGLLNSKLLNYYFSNVFTDYRDSFPLMKSGNIERLPIALANPETQNELIKLVFDIVNIKMKNNLTDTPSLENQIDQLVYQLYNLTEEEIEIIERSTKV